MANTTEDLRRVAVELADYVLCADVFTDSEERAASRARMMELAQVVFARASGMRSKMVSDAEIDIAAMEYGKTAYNGYPGPGPRSQFRDGAKWALGEESDTPRYPAMTKIRLDDNLMALERGARFKAASFACVEAIRTFRGPKMTDAQREKQSMLIRELISFRDDVVVPAMAAASKEVRALVPDADD